MQTNLYQWLARPAAQLLNKLGLPPALAVACAAVILALPFSARAEINFGSALLWGGSSDPASGTTDQSVIN
jgi:hypothetical protein